MDECAKGKLLIYTSSAAFCGLRHKPISLTVSRIAKRLGLDFELVKLKGKSRSIYVYYKNGEEDPVPLYFDKGGKAKSEEEVSSALKTMIFTLSFHPRYSDLMRVRDKIMRLS